MKPTKIQAEHKLSIGHQAQSSLSGYTTQQCNFVFVQSELTTNGIDNVKDQLKWSDPVKHSINFLNSPQAAMWRMHVQTWESVLKETL